MIFFLLISFVNVMSYIDPFYNDDAKLFTEVKFISLLFLIYRET